MLGLVLRQYALRLTLHACYLSLPACSDFLLLESPLHCQEVGFFLGFAFSLQSSCSFFVVFSATVLVAAATIRTGRLRGVAALIESGLQVSLLSSLLFALQQVSKWIGDIGRLVLHLSRLCRLGRLCRTGWRLCTAL